MKKKCSYKNCIVYQQIQLDVLLFNQERDVNRDLRLRFELDEKL
jgi:hypothetical protein